VREKIAIKKYSPENLLKLLESCKEDPDGEDNLDDLLNNW
jgi:hypothetical protein